MSCLILDAGALIALAKNDRTMWAAIKVAALRSNDIWVPTTALAQVWRGRAGQAQLARVLKYCLLAPFDPFAHQIGELCGRAKTRDLCDAHVAYVAAMRGGILYTSDVPDLRRLLTHCGKHSPTLVHC